MPENFLTAETLSTFAGQVLALGILVEILKRLSMGVITGARTQWLAVAGALAMQFIYAGAPLSAQGVFLNVINGVVVALTTMKGAEVLSGSKATPPGGAA